MREGKRKPLVLNSYQRQQLAARACVSPRTLERCYRSEPVRSSIAARITQAARELQLPEPNVVIAE